MGKQMDGQMDEHAIDREKDRYTVGMTGRQRYIKKT